jgi:hypothetical protein
MNLLEKCGRLQVIEKRSRGFYAHQAGEKNKSKKVKKNKKLKTKKPCERFPWKGPTSGKGRN